MTTGRRSSALDWNPIDRRRAPATAISAGAVCSEAMDGRRNGQATVHVSVTSS